MSDYIADPIHGAGHSASLTQGVARELKRLLDDINYQSEVVKLTSGNWGLRVYGDNGHEWGDGEDILITTPQAWRRWIGDDTVQKYTRRNKSAAAAIAL